jgi:hypothetical protein
VSCGIRVLCDGCVVSGLWVCCFLMGKPKKFYLLGVLVLCCVPR